MLNELQQRVRAFINQEAQLNAHKKIWDNEYSFESIYNDWTCNVFRYGSKYKLV
jgi:hypothetical protein